MDKEENQVSEIYKTKKRIKKTFKRLRRHNPKKKRKFNGTYRQNELKEVKQTTI